MSMMVCERCGKSDRVEGRTDDRLRPLDYCASCGKNLCSVCMTRGCCANVPARSGMTEDFPEEFPDDDVIPL